MNLNQVSLPAHDIARSIMFYETLGLKLIVRSDDYARFELPQGDATLSLYLTKADPSHAPAIHIYLECADVDQRVRELRAHGVEFSGEATDQVWLWCEAWLNDPARNEICLYHVGANRKNPPSRIG